MRGCSKTRGCRWRQCSKTLKRGATVDEIMEWFDVTREQIVAVLEFAARSLDPPGSMCDASIPVEVHVPFE